MNPELPAKSSLTGFKHLITCRCVLPQFKRLPSPPQHQFVVFSMMSEDGSVIPKFAQCNNCGIVHKVVEICRSEVVPRESLNAMVTIDDVKANLPSRLSSILEAHAVDLPTWEAAQFIYENKRWGEFVLLASDNVDGVKQGKYVQILGETMFKVDTFMHDQVVK